MVFSHDTITKKVLEKHVFLNNTEGLFVELNSKKCKSLPCRAYHPHSQSNECFFKNIDKAANTYVKYEKVLLFGSPDTKIFENLFFICRNLVIQLKR